MPAHRLLFRVPFARARQVWKQRRGGQSMIWRRGLKKLFSALASVSAIRFLVWGSRGGESTRLSSTRDMAENGIP